MFPTTWRCNTRKRWDGVRVRQWQTYQNFKPGYYGLLRDELLPRDECRRERDHQIFGDIDGPTVDGYRATGVVGVVRGRGTAKVLASSKRPRREQKVWLTHRKHRQD